ncbi:hypothetical protein EVJ58_g5308 [Rhodofomes roseus]|uniref:Uncharacterized protein n=1 Tax=Rhodofomes roseus TaxID=34475 RepID=A0A4Y9YDT7_9APHY|nr:hypothetical protein EVJ58_g5308 [Rhodofomes roseus]
MQVLRRYARSLHAHRLYLLEASLWGNALRQIEDVILTSGLGGAYPFLLRRGAEAGEDLHALREELVGRVEGAEARCFSAGAETGAITNTGAPQASTSTSQALSGEWVWEEMVGSWVQKSPVVEPAPKRRKLHHPKPLPAIDLHAPPQAALAVHEEEASGRAQATSFRASSDVLGGRARLASRRLRWLRVRPAIAMPPEQEARPAAEPPTQL